MAADFARLLGALGDAEVECVLIGGVAATFHGSARATFDLDVVYARSTVNLERIVSALAPLHAYLRDVPRGLPFRLDVPTLRAGLNFTLTTDAGALDLLGEVPGGGTFERLAPRSVSCRLFGFECRIVDLDALIELKRAAGRAKDLEALAELEAIRDARRR